MARTVRDANLGTRAARLRLSVRSEPYWRALESGVALGYRRRATGGTWLCRRRSGAGRYIEHKIGTADDLSDADGIAVLDYGQAQSAARLWWQTERRRDDGHEPARGPITVATAVADYLADLKRRGAKSVYQTKRAAETHILPDLGSVAVDRLTKLRIERWLHDLAEEPARARTAPGRSQNYRNADQSLEGRRRRQATANRVFTTLRAALNHAWNSGRVASDDAWRRVKAFRGVETARVRYLLADEVVRLVNATDSDFRPIVRAAVLTGCRWSELTAMVAADFNIDAGRITVRYSKAGKPRHVVLTDEGRQLFASLTAGRRSDELIFRRADGAAWGKSHQLRRMVEASKAARIEPVVTFHALRHTHASLLAMAGVPMRVIAEQLGHADTRMTEAHYAHLAPSYVAETIRASFPSLGIGDLDSSKIVGLSGKR